MSKIRFFTPLFIIVLLINIHSTAFSSETPNPPARYLVISTSLSPESNGALLAQEATRRLTQQGAVAEWIDLRQYPLPQCNGLEQSAYGHPSVKILHDKIAAATAVIIIAPIYNYDVAAATRNFVELTGTPYKDLLSGKAWKNKIVGMIAVAGGTKAYLAPLGFVNNLMTDFQCVIIPKHVYASRADFSQGVPSQDILLRVERLVNETIFFADRLYPEK